MKKITLFIAAIMASAAMFAEGTFTIEKLWENTNVPGMADVRQGLGWDSVFYATDKAKKKVLKITKDATVDYATLASNSVAISVDAAGNLIVGSGFSGTKLNTLQLIKKGTTTVEQVSMPEQAGRIDIFSAATGDVYSAEGGDLYLLGNTYANVVRVHIANGAVEKVDTVTNFEWAADKLANNTSLAIPTVGGNILVNNRTAKLVTLWNVAENKEEAIELPDVNQYTAGFCNFELGGKEFYAYNLGTNYAATWNLYNITDKVLLNEDPLYVKNTTGANSNSSANFLNCQKVDDNTVMIYQYHPVNGAAMWKVTYTPAEDPGLGTAVDNTIVAPQVQKIVRNGQVLIIRDGKTYNMMGQEVK